MANPDLTNLNERTNVIKEIEAEENIERKRYAQRSFDCFRERQHGYITENLAAEFDPDTVADMRMITSINLTKRIVQELSSIYSREPKREFSNASDRELEHIENLYSMSMFNAKCRVANQYYNLQNQGTYYFIPQNGVIKAKPLPLQSFDVIPDCDDSEKAYAYILNTWDLDLRNSRIKTEYTTTDQRYRGNNSMNERIADDNDRLKEHMRMVVWTPEVTFTMNGRGEIIGEVEENPIKRLPFIDFANGEKDSQFFVRRGSDIAEFGIEMGTILSDTATTSRNQGYAQGVVYSAEQPKFVKGNHNKWLWMQLDPERPEARPELSFVSPQPDLASSLSLVEILINMFLTSRGLDTSTISGQASGRSATSGIERLLMMIEKFEASREDFDVFRWVEHQSFDLFRDWSNALQGVTDGPLALDQDLQGVSLSDNIEMTVQFSGPEAIKSDEDQLNELERKLELGIISRKMMIEEYYGVEEERAIEIMQEIDEDMVDTNSLRMDNGEVRQDQGESGGPESDDQP